MRKEPEGRAGLGQRLRREALQSGREIANVAGKDGKSQSGIRGIAQSGKRIDPAGDASRTKILVHPSPDDGTRKRIIEPDPIVNG